MRVLVCGGRRYRDRATLDNVLDHMHWERRVALVIHGAANGADTLAGEWAASRGIAALAFPADWRQHGRAAGPIRNNRMLVEGKPDLVVAFPGGPGTCNMIAQAVQAKVAVHLTPGWR